MKNRNVVILTVILEILALGLWKSPGVAQELPVPRLVPLDETSPFSPSEFQRALEKLKSERAGLDADWKAITRRLNTPPPRDEPDLEKLQRQLEQWKDRLERERAAKAKEKSVPTPPMPHPVIHEKSS